MRLAGRAKQNRDRAYRAPVMNDSRPGFSPVHRKNESLFLEFCSLPEPVLSFLIAPLCINLLWFRV